MARCFLDWSDGLDFDDILGCGTPCAILDFKTYPFTFGKSPESLHVDRSVMDEQVTAFVFLNETIPLPVIKPFHCSFRQNIVSFQRGFMLTQITGRIETRKSFSNSDTGPQL